MSQPGGQGQAVRFASFEVDFQSGEIRKRGVKIRLAGQPFQVLALLLENAGAVVTREHLRDELWPGDTFVDFDNGVNAAIKRIRRALGDSAANPRFIETLLLLRGYRFIAPLSVEGRNREPGTASAGEHSARRKGKTLSRAAMIGLALVLTPARLFTSSATANPAQGNQHGR